MKRMKYEPGVPIVDKLMNNGAADEKKEQVKQ
jgi:hypothetical protein